MIVVPRSRIATKTIGTSTGTDMSTLFAVFFSLFFWIIVAGFSLPQTITSVAVLAGVCIWGLLLIKTLAPGLPDESDIGFWLLGPCVGIGAMFLFLLRLFVSEVIFLSIFLMVPLIWVALSARAWFRWRFLIRDFVDSLQNSIFVFLFTTGLVGLTLIRGWDWAAPITAAAILSALLLSTRIASTKLTSSFLFVSLLPATFWAISSRTQFWWRSAEGVPFDETILEAISKGLIRWGPTTNPLHHGLDGASAAAYHHLLYFSIGLTDRFSQPGPYEALLIVAPIVSGFSICLTLVLLARVLLRDEAASARISPTVLLGLIACFLGLRGEGFGSPSTWFGIASLTGFLLLVVVVPKYSLRWSHLALVAFSVVTVAFSKGVFVYATVLMSISLAAFNWKAQWKIAVTTTAVAVAVVVWFSWASVRVDEFAIEFWPYRNFQSQFSFDLYTLRVFLNRLISPVILGITSAILLRNSKKSIFRQISFSLIVVIVVGVASQIFITSTGPRSFDLFYVPAIFATSALVLLLAVSTNRDAIHRYWHVYICFGVALLNLNYAPSLGDGTINPLTIATLGIGLYFVFVWMSNKFDWRGPSLGMDRSVALSSLFITFTAVVVFVSQSFPNFPKYTRAHIESQSIDWTGSLDFNDVVSFIDEKTARTSLFAFSVCDPNSVNSCETDFRPAALTKRRFLALDPLFFEKAVDDRTWGDVELSRAIGVRPSAEVIDDLEIRGVNYVLIDRSRVNNEWVQKAMVAGAANVYSNKSYFVLLINTL